MMERRKHIKSSQIVKSVPLLFEQICRLIENSRNAITISVNREITLINWQIGHLIQQHILKGSARAKYGEQIVATLSQQLTRLYGKGYTRTALNRMIAFANAFSLEEISATLSHQLSWSHFIELTGVKENLKREFYTQLCINERWSVRLLRERIDSMLFERTAISKKPETLIEKELKALKNKEKPGTELFFRDPYILDFLGLKDTYSEKDLESSILAELQRFIIELGSDFAFLARQKRIQIDSEDYYIDLLFYHRQLQRLVAVDLKLGKFKAAYKAQMELYLNWLNKYERREAEQQPVGLILCADKSDEHIELLELNKGNIRVAQYYTELPPKKLLEQKLHKAWLAASERFSENKRKEQ